MTIVHVFLVCHEKHSGADAMLCRGEAKVGLRELSLSHVPMY